MSGKRGGGYTGGSTAGHQALRLIPHVRQHGGVVIRARSRVRPSQRLAVTSSSNLFCRSFGEKKDKNNPKPSSETPSVMDGMF